MSRWQIKKLHIIERGKGNAGDEPLPGDIVEVECVGGFVKQVDPHTMKTRDAHQRFVMGKHGSLKPAH